MWPSMDNPSIQELLKAKEWYADLLATRDTKEREWQRFFTAQPFVLSMGLPLKLQPSDIHPRARAGRCETDFWIYPRAGRPNGNFGVIELKRPDSKIITRPRQDLLVLSRDAETAIRQATRDAVLLQSQIIEVSEELLFVGTPVHIFVIMGLTSQLLGAFRKGLVQTQMHGLLPPNVQILAYDELYRRFSSELRPALHILVPASMPELPLAMPNGSDLERRPLGLGKFFDQLRGFGLLHSRIDVRTTQKQAIAQYVVENYIARWKRPMNLFFESGSSVAFISAALSKHLDRSPRLGMGPDFFVETNNVVSYLDLGLRPSGEVELKLYPEGPPEHKYGAMFGRLSDLFPPAPGEPPSSEAAHAVHELARHFADAPFARSLILSSASKFDLEPSQPDPGPYTGSYANSLFKRALLQSRRPILFVADGNKFGPADLHREYPVCCSDLPWTEVCHGPIGLVVSSESDARRQCVLRQAAIWGFVQIGYERAADDLHVDLLGTQTFHRQILMLG